jgi:protein O-GlcNAc transferase
MSIKKPLEDYIGNIKEFLHKGDFSNALSIINNALTDYPSNPKLYINGGNIYKINGDLKNAEIYFKKALILHKSKEVLNNLSVIELERYNYQQSIDYAMDAIKLDPSYSDAYYNLALSLERIGDYSQAINYADKSYILSDLDANIGSGIEHPFLNISRTDDEAINFIVAKSWAENNILKTPMKVDINNNEKNNKIRLGYICGELRNHPTYHLIKNLFKNHNKEDFEIYIFSYNHENDIQNEIQKDVDQFISIDGTSDKDAIEIISKLNIDILIDLSIIITNNRQKIISSRPAKKVISYLGYPGTSGYDFYDYIITDKIVTPENIQPYYLEKFLYLPNTYQVSNGIKNIPMKGNLKSDYGLPNESVVLSCFNQSFKIDKIIFESWMNILKNLSSAYLWILEDNEVAKENLTECAKLHGISSDRLIFAPRIDRDRHLERLTLVDVALDTRIYNGHTTTTDALQSSVPVVTIMGKHFASRVSSSLLSLIGLDELIAHNTQEYEEKIIKLCSEKNYLKKIKEKLSNDVCMKKFYDIKEFTYEFELCLKGILKN